MARFIDLTGLVFGKLTVVSLSERKNRRTMWLCRCSCGNEKVICAGSIKRGLTRSCGCLYGKSKITHNQSNSSLYEVWAGIKKRVSNPNSRDWEFYGGRGIKICEGWLSFEKFEEDMVDGYKEGLTIDRINVDGDYCLENCRWVGMGIQGHNKRKRQGCSSKFIGVCYNKKDSKFVAHISINGCKEYIGTFCQEISAAIAYDNRSEELYGDRPNKTKGVVNA